jgi:hypothetical protein
VPPSLQATSSGITAAMEGAGDSCFEVAVAPALPAPGSDTMPDATQPLEVAQDTSQGAIVPNPRPRPTAGRTGGAGGLAEG